MNTWDEMPLDLRDKLPTEVKAAIKVFTDEEIKSLYMGFEYEEPHEFIGVGFNGPDGRFTKFAELGKAMAIGVIEDYIRNKLNGLSFSSPFVTWPRNMGISCV